MQLPLLTIIEKSPNKHYVGLVEWREEKEFAGKGKPRKFNNSDDPWINGRAVVTQITKSVGRLQVLALLHRFQENDWMGNSGIRYSADETLPDRIQAAVDNWRKAQNTSGGNNP